MIYYIREAKSYVVPPPRIKWSVEETLTQPRHAPKDLRLKNSPLSLSPAQYKSVPVRSERTPVFRPTDRTDRHKRKHPSQAIEFKTFHAYTLVPIPIPIPILILFDFVLVWSLIRIRLWVDKRRERNRVEGLNWISD